VRFVYGAVMQELASTALLLPSHVLSSSSTGMVDSGIQHSCQLGTSTPDGFVKPLGETPMNIHQRLTCPLMLSLSQCQLYRIPQEHETCKQAVNIAGCNTTTFIFLQFLLLQ